MQLASSVGAKPGIPTGSFQSRAGNCILLTITIICMCILVVCGVMIVREYSLAKGYEATTCTLKEIKYRNSISCFYCGTGEKGGKKKQGSCKNTVMPCLLLVARYHGNQEGLLHPDSLQASGRYSKCSYYVCLKSEALNSAAVEKYASTFRPKIGTTFDCFYSQNSPGHLIMEKMHTRTEVIHSMLWPSLVIVLCGCIFLKMEFRRRGITLCASRGRDSPRGGATTGDQQATRLTEIAVQKQRNGKEAKTYGPGGRRQVEQQEEDEYEKKNSMTSQNDSRNNSSGGGQVVSATVEDGRVYTAVAGEGARKKVNFRQSTFDSTGAETPV